MKTIHGVVSVTVAMLAALTVGCGASTVEDVEVPPSPSRGVASSTDQTEPTNGEAQAPSDDGRTGLARCSLQVSCRNGACACTGGPNANASCDGSGSGAGSCTVLCQSCGGDAADRPGGNPPSPGDDGDRGDEGDWDDEGDGDQGGGCSTAIRCVNGACTCTAGPNAGSACDGTTSSNATSCSVRCKVCD